MWYACSDTLTLSPSVVDLVSAYLLSRLIYSNLHRAGVLIRALALRQMLLINPLSSNLKARFKSHMPE